MPTPAELFAHCPRCGAAHPGSAGRVPFECPACGLCLFFNPTVAAAVFLVRPDGAALFIRRAHDPMMGKLAIPGGFVDFGESAEDGLRREVREEVGLDVTDLQFVCSCPNRYEYRGVTYPVCDLIFAATPVNPETATALDGVAGIEWHAPNAVDPAEIAFDSIRRGRDVLAGRG